MRLLGSTAAILLAQIWEVSCWDVWPEKGTWYAHLLLISPVPKFDPSLILLFLCPEVPFASKTPSNYPLPVLLLSTAN